MDEVNDFFSNLPVGNEEQQFNISDAITKKEEPQKEESVSQSAEKETPVEDEEKIPFAKNPKIQRFIEKQVKKALGERPSEVTKEVVREPDPTIPAEWIMAYGDTDNSRQAWAFQQKLIDQAVQRAKSEAVQEVEQSFKRSKEEEKRFQALITDNLETIEDTHSVDLTSNAPVAKKARAEFLDLIEKLSPKDQDGNVTSYADFSTAWDLYQSTKTKEVSSEVTNQKKQIAGRAMVRSNETKTVNPNAPRSNITFDAIQF